MDPACCDVSGYPTDGVRRVDQDPIFAARSRDLRDCSNRPMQSPQSLALKINPCRTYPSGRGLKARNPALNSAVVDSADRAPEKPWTDPGIALARAVAGELRREAVSRQNFKPNDISQGESEIRSIDHKEGKYLFEKYLLTNHMDTQDTEGPLRVKLN
jgi:hypothetical protein